MRALRIVRLTITSIFILSFYGFATNYSQRTCLSNNTLKCNLLNLISYPAIFFEDGLKNTYRLSTNFLTSGALISSGLIVDKIEETNKRFSDLPPGFDFYYPAGSRKNAGYLILSRSNPEFNGKPSVELWDMNNQDLIHEYKFNIEDIRDKIGVEIETTSRLHFKHPLILNDGSLIVNSLGNDLPLLKVDKCGNFLKSNSEYKFHHSLELGPDQNIYVPIRDVTKNLDKNLHGNNFRDEGFAVIDRELNILKVYSLLEIYKKNGILSDIYGRDTLTSDPFHLNDVQPYKAKNGDINVLLSLRNQSTLIALDLKSEEIIWKLERIAFNQHDIDLIKINSDGSMKIGLFDNNVWSYSGGNKLISYGNKFITMDNLPSFKSQNNFLLIGEKSDFFKYDLKVEDFKFLENSLRPKTVTSGRSELLISNNSLMLEESNYGRLFEMDLDSKNLLWNYLNKKNEESPIYKLIWSRRISNLPNNLNLNIFNSCRNN